MAESWRAEGMRGGLRSQDAAEGEHSRGRQLARADYTPKSNARNVVRDMMSTSAGLRGAMKGSSRPWMCEGALGSGTRSLGAASAEARGTELGLPPPLLSSTAPPWPPRPGPCQSSSSLAASAQPYIRTATGVSDQRVECACLWLSRACRTRT